MMKKRRISKKAPEGQEKKRQTCNAAKRKYQRSVDPDIRPEDVPALEVGRAPYGRNTGKT